MTSVTPLELLQRAVRSKVCPTCSKRPVGSDNLPATQARSCEGECPVFVHLPRLARIAGELEGDPLAPFEQAVRDGVCSHCTLSPTAGDYCYRGLTRTCPLSCHAGKVLTAIEPLVLKHCGCD